MARRSWLSKAILLVLLLPGTTGVTPKVQFTWEKRANYAPAPKRRRSHWHVKNGVKKEPSQSLVLCCCEVRTLGVRLRRTLGSHQGSFTRPAAYVRVLQIIKKPA